MEARGPMLGKMFVVDGTDYSIFVLAAILAAVSFVVQMFLCSRASRVSVRLLPVYFSAVPLALSLLLYIFPSNSPGSFISASAVASLFLLIPGAAIASGCALAWLVCAIRRKRTK